MRPGFLTVGVWTEKKPGLGEDAEPLLLHNWAKHRGIAAVFDGAGGAGAASAGITQAGTERTHAWIASRAVRGLVEEWFVDTRRPGPSPSDELRELLATGLGELRGGSVRKIVGSMRRELPTTLAAVAYRVRNAHIEWNVLWAGDSRTFLLSARDGLQQLSVDDTAADDALVLLVDDPVMTNMVCADRSFEINVARGESPMPCLLVAATDGFFGYVNTPAEAEHVLLDTLMAAESVDHWAMLLAETVGSYTGDDSSLAIVAFGFADIVELRSAFQRRNGVLATEHVAPMRRAADADRETFVAARAESWRRYRSDYERRMPLRQEEEQPC